MDKATAQSQDRRVYAIPEDTRVYAIGDIHGRLDLLDRLLDKIVDDSRDAPARKVLISLGDMIDRGPHSAGVIERLRTLPERDPFDTFEHQNLKGNHDQLMIDFLRGHDDAVVWLNNGGAATLESYGITDCWGDPDDIRRDLQDQIPEPHLEFLDTLKTLHREGGYVFAHAGIRPSVPLEKQDDEDLMWIREGFLNCDADMGVRVVHGHTPVNVPDVVHNRIGVDTRAWASNALTAFVGQGTDVKFITT